MKTLASVLFSFSNPVIPLNPIGITKSPTDRRGNRFEGLCMWGLVHKRQVSFSLRLSLFKVPSGYETLKKAIFVINFDVEETNQTL